MEHTLLVMILVVLLVVGSSNIALLYIASLCSEHQTDFYIDLVSNEVKLFLRIILPSMKLPPILISCGKLSLLVNIRRDKSEMTDSIAIDSRKHNMDIEE